MLSFSWLIAANFRTNQTTTGFYEYIAIYHDFDLDLAIKEWQNIFAPICNIGSLVNK